MPRALAHDDRHHVAAALDCISPSDEQALVADERRKHVVGLSDGRAQLREMRGQQVRVPLGDVARARPSVPRRFQVPGS